ncbi:SIK1 nucleolar protein Nop56 [Cryptosporidium canis]|uniref:Nucleolar protein 56 n=1 Tax=Cryptosporidium canis TaxID=195482 RepID=A0ABQ8P3N6_9CRYT|nr:SIK1 nucleolar protein Nop56 [Cryptosporidium canis]KAJ1607182.1 SIK1 nucleolar protein Nop56 [Cryptosporidium canis]
MAGDKKLYVLFESAAGYLLCNIDNWEEIGQVTESVMEVCADPMRFGQVAQFTAFFPFQTAEMALENMKEIQNGNATEELQTFLTQNLPKKVKKYNLGVGDVSLGKTLSDKGYPVVIDKNISELLRGIRVHFTRIVKSFDTSIGDLHKFQVGLGHSFSRNKLQFDPNKQDKSIIQSIALIDRLDKDINLFSMRCREWYSWHFPELGKIITDSEKFLRVAALIGNKDQFEDNEENRKKISKIVDDPSLEDDIFSSILVSMGQDITENDMKMIKSLAKQLIALYKQRAHLIEYLNNRLHNVAPNLQSLLGDTLAARLIAHSGSLVSLAKSPASTIQVLGAEKALFRALKSKGNTPKYGLLFQSTYIGKASQKNKGRISRYLANKCSIAARIDNFSTVSNNVFGEKLKQQVEDRLKYLSEGISPPKNIDIMREAISENQEIVDSIAANQAKSEKKKKRKSKESSQGEDASRKDPEQVQEGEESPEKKKKKKRKSSEQ